MDDARGVGASHRDWEVRAPSHEAQGVGGRAAGAA